MTRLTGRDAIGYAEAHGRTLRKYADPIEGAREGLSLSEALDVAREDESLIYVDVESTYTARDLVLCESPDGWSLHAPGSTDEEIAEGDAPYLLSGEGEPTKADYDRAFRLWREQEGR